MTHQESEFEICVCGHGEYEHEFRVVGFDAHVLRLECKKEHCGCNEYEKVGDFTYSQWMDYQKKNEVEDQG